jgi:hypothetical protein
VLIVSRYISAVWLLEVRGKATSRFTKVHGIIYPDISESLHLNGFIRVYLKTNLKWG